MILSQCLQDLLFIYLEGLCCLSVFDYILGLVCCLHFFECVSTSLGFVSCTFWYASLDMLVCCSTCFYFFVIEGAHIDWCSLCVLSSQLGECVIKFLMHPFCFSCSLILSPLFLMFTSLYYLWLYYRRYFTHNFREIDIANYVARNVHAKTHSLDVLGVQPYSLNMARVLTNPVSCYSSTNSVIMIMTLYYAYVITTFLGYIHGFTRTYFSCANIAKLVFVFTRFGLPFSSGLQWSLELCCRREEGCRHMHDTQKFGK